MMRLCILFDKSVPVPLRRSLSHHTVRTAAQLGWDTVENGALIARAEAAGYGLFLTCDQNIAYQQNLQRRKVAIVVLGSNVWRAVQERIPHIVAEIDRSAPGSYAFVEITQPPRNRTLG